MPMRSVSLALLLATPAIVMAQAVPGHEGPLAALDLTPQQRAEVKAIRQKYGHPQTHEAKRAMRQEVMGVLTPAQRAKVKEYREHHKGAGRHGRK